MTTITHFHREGFNPAVTAIGRITLLKAFHDHVGLQLWLNGILIKIVARGPWPALMRCIMAVAAN